MTFSEMEQWARKEYDNLENEDAMTVLGVLIDVIARLAEKEKEGSETR